MTRLRLLPFVILVLLSARSVEAQGAFFDGSPVAVSGGFCVGQSTPYILSQIAAGYFTNGTTVPKTGDIVYVRAISYNIHPCSNEVVGFSFVLPDGASLAISPSTPVLCDVGVIGQNPSENVAPKYGACLQTPTAGAHGGLYFGFSKVARGYYAQFRVPVVFNKKLLGIGGPLSHRLNVIAQSTGGVVQPYQPVIVFYQASFANIAAVSITNTAAFLTFNLNAYFEPGILYFDFGKTPSFEEGSPSAVVPDDQATHEVEVELTGLDPSTTYYWRARFVTSGGATFTTPTQTFLTTGGSAQQLTVITGGLGSGVVTSSPSGIICGANCLANYSTGVVVNLTATPDAGMRLAGWGGACSGTGACSVTMNAAKTVNASFMREMGSLSVTVTGLPPGNSADLSITGPDGFNLTPTVPSGMGVNYSDVGTGTYTVSAPILTISGTDYSAPMQSAMVNFGTTSTINVVYAAVTEAPTDVTATAIVATAVEISWTAVTGVTYEVQRTGPKGDVVTVGTTKAGGSKVVFTDKTAAANTSYLYKVRAILPSVSVYSGSDLATTVIFTDPTLTPQSTGVKAAHITQLRTAVDALRALAGLGPGSYTDPTLTVAATGVKAAHVTDLRTALAEARTALLLASVAFTRPTINPGMIISAADINELRLGVR